MKTKLMIAAVAVCALLAACIPAVAQESPAQLYTLAAPSNTLAAASTSSWASTILRGHAVPAGKVLVFGLTQRTAGAGTSNIVYNLKTSMDGVTWSSTNLTSVTSIANGTNSVYYNLRVWTNIPARYFALGSIENPATNALTWSIKYFWGEP